MPAAAPAPAPVRRSAPTRCRVLPVQPGPAGTPAGSHAAGSGDQTVRPSLYPATGTLPAPAEQVSPDGRGPGLRPPHPVTGSRSV